LAVRLRTVLIPSIILCRVFTRILTFGLFLLRSEERISDSRKKTDRFPGLHACILLVGSQPLSFA